MQQQTSTTYKCCLFKTGDFVLKTPACFAISFGLRIVSQKVFFLFVCLFFYQRSSLALLTTVSLEMHNGKDFHIIMHWPLASAQFFSIII